MIRHQHVPSRRTPEKGTDLEEVAEQGDDPDDEEHERVEERAVLLLVEWQNEQTQDLREHDSEQRLDRAVYHRRDDPYGKTRMWVSVDTHFDQSVRADFQCWMCFPYLCCSVCRVQVGHTILSGA